MCVREFIITDERDIHNNNIRKFFVIVIEYVTKSFLVVFLFYFFFVLKLKQNTKNERERQLLSHYCRS